jgi:hypothetical protein
MTLIDLVSHSAAVLSLVQELSFMLLVEWDHILKMTEFALEFVKLRSRHLNAPSSPNLTQGPQTKDLTASAMNREMMELAAIKSIRLWIFQILDCEERMNAWS